MTLTREQRIENTRKRVRLKPDAALHRALARARDEEGKWASEEGRQDFIAVVEAELQERPKRSCRGCRHSGMDMDMEPYCAHPDVLKRAPHGVHLSNSTAPTRAEYECPLPGLPLWEVRA